MCNVYFRRKEILSSKTILRKMEGERQVCACVCVGGGGSGGGDGDSVNMQGYYMAVVQVKEGAGAEKELAHAISAVVILMTSCF